MDDFFYERKRGLNDPFFRNDSFFDDTFSPFNRKFPFDSSFSIINNMHREMDEMMRSAFNSFGYYSPIQRQPNHLAIEQPSINKDQDLDKQVQTYGLNSIFDDNLSEWDFVKQLENIEKENYAKSVIQKNPNPNGHFYGRSHFYNYISDGNKVEEKKIVQDSLGRRVESVQKKLGDKVWAKTIKRNEKGEIDENEKMFNMDDQDKDQFMANWKNRYQSSIDIKPQLATDQSIVDEAVAPNKTPLTLASLEQKPNRNWLDKLKFWK